MGLVYEIHLIDTGQAPVPDTDTLRLNDPASAMAFGLRMAKERLSSPSAGMMALARKARVEFPGEVNVLAGENDEMLAWDEARPIVPIGQARCSRRWTLMFDGELVSRLVPQLLYWCRQTKIDAYDPQLQVYFAWNDPNGLAKIADPLAQTGDAVADKPVVEYVTVQMWAAKIAPVPPDAADAATLLKRLEGKTLKGRRFYQAAGQDLWSALALQLPSLRAALEAFDNDPCNWGADLEAPCLAIWTLGIRTSVWPTAWPLLCDLAKQRQLCVFVPGSPPVWYAPGMEALPVPQAPPPVPPAVQPSAFAPSGGLIAEVAASAAAGPKEQNSADFRQVSGELAAAALAGAIDYERTAQVRDALAKALQAQGFRRKGSMALEKHYSHGALLLLVETEARSDGSTVLRVTMGAKLRASQKVIQQFRRDSVLPPGDLGPESPSLLADILYYRDLTTPGGAGNSREHQEWHCTYRSPQELAEQLEKIILPVVREVLKEPTPWFMDPPNLLAHLKKSLGEGGFTAGLLLMNMEDVILARLCGEPDWDGYLALRTEVARGSPDVSRATPQSLARMAEALVRKVPVDEELSKARALHDGTQASPLGKAGWALFLGPLVGLVGMRMGLPDGVLVVAVLTSMAYVAWQLFKVGGETPWRFLLPLTVLFPPLAILTIVVLGLRRK